MGVIGPNNQLPRRRVGRREQRSALLENEEDLWTENGHVSRAKTDEQKQWLNPEAESSKAFEALSLFPHPKALLTRVIQAATSSNRIRVCSSQPEHNER